MNEMFSSGTTEVARSDGGVVSPVLIPKRFVWPYGGRNVYLTGSFTRWSEHLPMTPVEGCPTLFQTVYRLRPGYHEYKFFVDGEWRHDENTPCVNGTYGLVNTVILEGEADHLTSISSTQVSSISNMDLDNEAFDRVVSISDSNYQGAMLTMPQPDLEMSRRRLSEYLSTHTAYELLPDSGKVIAFDVDLPVKQAFHILYEQGISMAPLWDFHCGQFVGVLTPLDFILILKELGNHGSNLSEEELELHTVSAWKEDKVHLNRKIGAIGRASSRSLVHGGPHETLKSIVLKILHYGVSTVPILYSPSSGSCPQILHLSSLSGILKCICRYFRSSLGLLPALQLPIYAVSLGTRASAAGEVNKRPLTLLRTSAPLSSALNLFLEAQVSSIPIVDDNGSLLNIYCRSDIIHLAKDRLYARLNLDEITILQALHLSQDPYNPPELNKCQTCTRSDRLFEVMERLAKPGVRRVVIVEPGTNRVEGIITLSDVFRFLLG